MLPLCVIEKGPTFPIHKISITLLIMSWRELPQSTYKIIKNLGSKAIFTYKYFKSKHVSFEIVGRNTFE